MELVKELVLPIGGILLFSIISVALIMAMAYPISKASCEQSFPQLETHYSLITSCQVKTKDGWIPSDNYRVM